MTKKSRSVSAQGHNQLRIIGGRWRSRVLRFPSIDGLRPTPDRVRETLFNWLQHDIPGARCLDLFSGSGALGLEAVSRGASEAVLVDASNAVTQQLKINLGLLGCQQVEVYCATALDWIRRSDPPNGTFDIVFLDPPFASEMLDETIRALANSRLLSPTACIYAESPLGAPAPITPADWALRREKKAGRVLSRLYQLGNFTEI